MINNKYVYKIVFLIFCGKIMTIPQENSLIIDKYIVIIAFLFIK